MFFLYDTNYSVRQLIMKNQFSFLLFICLCFKINQISAEYNNIYNQPLEICGTSPVTGYFRNGYCTTTDQDYGTHVACAQVTDAFLQYSKSMGNDLITSRGSFSGLKDGDFWCLCISRWEQARQANAAPPLKLKASHIKSTSYVSLSTLEEYDMTLFENNTATKEL